MKSSTRRGLTISAFVIILCLLGVILYWWVASAIRYKNQILTKHEDSNWRIVLAQQANYSFEPYTTLVYTSKNGQPWKEYQLDFEDSRWSHGSIIRNGALFMIYRDDSLQAVFNTSTEEVFITKYNRSDPSNRTMKKGWHPTARSL